MLAVLLSAAPAVWPNTGANPRLTQANPAADADPTRRPPRPGNNLAATEAALHREVHRLRRHLAAAGEWHESARNPFAWTPSGVAHERRAAAEPSSISVSAPRGLTTPLPFTLIGIAENRTGAEPERFAILAWNGEPVIAAEGARVGGRYVVRRIEAGAIEVIDCDAASSIRLTLENN